MPVNGRRLIQVVLSASLACALLLLFIFAPGWFPTCHSQSQKLPLEVWYDGCSAVWKGPLCLLERGKPIFLWVKTVPRSEIEINFGKGAIYEELEPQDGGKRYKVVVPRGARLGRVVSTNEKGRGDWQIQLGDAPIEPGWLVDARALRREPRTEDAIRLVEPHLEDADSTWRARAQGLRGRLALDQGQIELACQWLEQAAQLNAKLGHDSEANLDFSALAFQLIEIKRDFAGGRRAIDRAPMPIGHMGSMLSIGPRQFNLAYQTGNLSEALSRAEDNVRISQRRMPQPDDSFYEQDLALWQIDLGLIDEAAARFDEIRRRLPPDAPACQRQLVLNNEAWSLILARENGTMLELDPAEMLEEARQLLEGPCAMPQEKANNRVNLALAYLQKNDIDQTKAHLSWLREQSRTLLPDEEAVRLEIEGRVALLEGHPDEALAIFKEQERISELALLPDFRWSAVVWQARALAQQNQTLAALEQYDRAEYLSKQATLRAPIGQHRATFVAKHRRAVQEHVQLLVQQKRVEEAMHIIREERVRALDALSFAARASVKGEEIQAQIESALASYWKLRKELDDQASADWQLSQADSTEMRQRRQEDEAALNRLLNKAYEFSHRGTETELMPQMPDELLLLYFPLEKGWLGFAKDDEGVVVHELGSLDWRAEPERLAQQLLVPFDEKIAGARRIKVLSMGEMERVSLASLPWRDKPLAQSRIVVYGLDLAPLSTARDCKDSPNILSVTDPSFDLPGAHREAQILRQVLKRAPTSLRLYDRGKVDAAQLKDEFGRSCVFHFSGHGKFQGIGGWNSELLLSEESKLRATDVLALRRAPLTAVLLGCETARASNNWSVGLGMAHAFLLAGSQVVLASSDPISDVLGANLVAELYNDWQGQVLSVAQIHAALLRAEAAQPDSAWGLLRILVN